MAKLIVGNKSFNVRPVLFGMGEKVLSFLFPHLLILSHFIVQGDKVKAVSLGISSLGMKGSFPSDSAAHFPSLSPPAPPWSLSCL